MPDPKALERARERYNAKHEMVNVRLVREEMAVLDRLRGHKTRAAWVREVLQAVLHVAPTSTKAEADATKRAMARDFIAQGMTHEDAAAQLGVSTRTVYRALWEDQTP